MPNATNKIVPFLKLVRYPNLLIMAATQLLCAVWLTYHDAVVWYNGNFWFTLAATILIAAGGYIINDIFDFDADSINKPDKVIITTQNKQQMALAYYGISVLGILCGLAASVVIGLVCAAMVALLYRYSYKLKKTIFTGNIAVAVMSAMVLLILLLVFEKIEAFAVWIYAAFAFFTTLVREIAKDIEDLDGDKKANYPTLPVVKGKNVAKKIAVIETALLLLCIIAFAVWCIISLRVYAFFYLIIMTALPTIGLGLLLYWGQEKEHFSQASLLSKLIMISGIISMYFIL